MASAKYVWVFVTCSFIERTNWPSYIMHIHKNWILPVSCPAVCTCMKWDRRKYWRCRGCLVIAQTYPEILCWMTDWLSQQLHLQSFQFSWVCPYVLSDIFGILFSVFCFIDRFVWLVFLSHLPCLVYVNKLWQLSTYAVSFKQTSCLVHCIK